MAKEKAQAKITQVEILNLAIQAAYRRYRDYADRAVAGMSAENLAIIESAAAPWREKLKVLLLLYNIETGTDYGLDLDLDGE